MIYKTFISIALLCSFTAQTCAMAVFAQTQQTTSTVPSDASQKELTAELFKALAIKDQRELFFAISALYDRGVDINAQDEEGNTPLMLAAKNRHEMTAETLSFFGARSDIDNKKQETFGEVAPLAIIKAVKQARLAAAKQPYSPLKS